jgi:phage-related protein (TIGR01555 family)
MTIKKETIDGWANILTGVGTNLDKASYALPSWSRMDRQLAESIYASDDMGSKIASIVPEDGTRQSVDWIIPNGENPDLVLWVEKEFDRLEIWQKLCWAWTQARVFGGSLIYISVADGRETYEPIDWKNVARINSLNVFDRWQLSVNSGEIISDIADPNFGLPAYYNFMSGNSPSPETPPMRIHHSRVIRFDGIKLPTRLFIKNNYWHDSIYSKLYKSIRNYSSSYDSVANILTDFNQPVFKVEGLADSLAMDGGLTAQKKVEIVALSRSVARAVILDKQDDFQTVGASVSGLGELLQMTTDRLVGGSNIPHTRLLGESPSGLGATGRSELTDYYDMIKANQEIVLRHPINYLLKLLFLQIKAPDYPEGFSFNFSSLYQTDQATVIATRKQQADIDAIYIDRGVYDPSTVSEARFATGEYSFETSINEQIFEESPVASQFDLPSESNQPQNMGAEQSGDISKTALNGAQVSSLLEITQSVAGGLLPRDSGVAIIMNAFQMEQAVAEKIMGSIGKGFVQKPVIE